MGRWPATVYENSLVATSPLFSTPTLAIFIHSGGPTAHEICAQNDIFAVVHLWPYVQKPLYSSRQSSSTSFKFCRSSSIVAP